jgi:ArsR family transcriptional regulator
MCDKCHIDGKSHEHYHQTWKYANNHIYFLMNMRDYQSTAQFFQVLAHPVRLQILAALSEQACCVCHLQALTRRPQAYVSQQMRVLRDAGMVSDEKDGQNVYYRLCNPTVEALLHEVIGSDRPRTTIADCNCPKCVDE